MCLMIPLHVFLEMLFWENRNGSIGRHFGFKNDCLQEILILELWRSSSHVWRYKSGQTQAQRAKHASCKPAGRLKAGKVHPFEELEFAWEKNNEIICFFILKGCPMILLAHTDSASTQSPDIGKRIHCSLRSGPKVLQAAPMPMGKPSMSQGDWIFVACCSQVSERYSKFHVGNASKPYDYWHKLSTSTENRLSYSENVSRR